MSLCYTLFLFVFFKRVRERKKEVKTLEKVLQRSLGHTDLIEMSTKKNYHLHYKREVALRGFVLAVTVVVCIFKAGLIVSIWHGQ